MILVRVDCDGRSMTRYECGGECARPTHRYVHPCAVMAFAWEAIQHFRSNPPDEFSLEPSPSPTNPAAAAASAVA